MATPNDKMDDAVIECLRLAKQNNVRMRLCTLTHLTDGDGRLMDRHLQRMRRGGLIRYDSKAGWLVVEHAEEARP